MTFEQFKKNVEREFKENSERELRFCTLSLSTTEWLLFHDIFVNESREITGNIFQPYSTVTEVRIPSFILVCKDNPTSPTGIAFKKKRFPLLICSSFSLPAKKDTGAFVETFMKNWLQKSYLN